MALTKEGMSLPCRNPSCKSQGTSHPNCQCYSDQPDVQMAAGGVAGHYCSQNIGHTPSCQYYMADGGQVADTLPQTGAKALKQLRSLIPDKADTEDPSSAVAAVLAHSGAGNLFSLHSNGLFNRKPSFEAKDLGTRSKDFLSGIGAASQGGQNTSEEQLDSPWFRRGVDFHNKLTQVADNREHDNLEPIIEKLTGRSATNSHMMPAALHLMSNEATPEEMSHGLDYAHDIHKGHQALDKAISSLFEDPHTPVTSQPDDRALKKLREFIEDGEMNRRIASELAPQQAFAGGGMVSGAEETAPPVTQGSEYLAKHFPEHNTLLQAVKGRVNNYLNELRPQEENTPKLPFDSNLRDKKTERNYNSALNIAHDPISVLNRVKSGSITPSHIQHLGNMYPEVYQDMSKRLTEKIAQSQFDKRQVPRHVKRSMAIFLAAPLDSTMTPQSIQTIQGMYAQKKAQGQQTPPVTGKKSTQKLTSLAENAQTPGQALQQRKALGK